MSPEYASTAIPDKEKTREELLYELRALKARNAILEESEAKAKRLESVVRANEEMFRATFEQSAVGMTHVSTDGRFLRVNKKYCDITGYGEEELLGMPVVDVTFPPDVEEEKAEIKRLLAGEADTFSRDKRYVRKDGSLIWVKLTAAVVWDNGKPGYLIGVIEDITDRKMAEESLEKYRLFSDNARDIVLFIDRGGQILEANKAAITAYGYTREELLSMTIYDLRAKDPGHRVDKQMNTAFSVGLLFETEHIRKDGSVFPVKVSSQGKYINGRKVILSVVRDITERKRAEKDLRLTQFSIDRAADIALWVAPDGHFTYANEAAYKAFGYSREEFNSLRAFDTNPYFNEKNWGLHWKEVKKQGSNTFEARLRRKDGSFFPGEITVNYIVYEGKEYNCSFIRDITERKRAEDALKNAKAQVELYLDLMGHDIGNMNQISMGFLELAMGTIETEGKLDKENTVLLDKAMGALKDSSRLIDNVRKLQREKMGEYRPELIDVGTMVEDGIKQFESVPGRNIKITCDTADHCHVLANALLKDVFVNLIGNAIKHSRGDLEIKVRVGRALDNGRKYCRVDIEDNGPGIPDQLKATLFDRLNLTTTRAKGKGFGLCLIKMLVDDYEGKFWAEDRVPGDHSKGAKFVVMLPAVEK